jgi:hypothetical protein
MRITRFIFLGLFVGACNISGAGDLEKTQTTAIAGAWSSDVIGVTEMHLSADYWVEQIDNADQLLLDQAAIAEFNRKLFATDPHMVELGDFPEQLPGAEVKERIRAISKPYKTDLYGENGKVLSGDVYRTYEDNLGLENIPGKAGVRFGLVVNRSDMRRFPTDDRYISSQDTRFLDRFQENGLFPGEAVAVLHDSADGQWSFAQSYNYAAWVRSENIAIGERQVIERYRNSGQFLVITGDKVWTSFNPDVPALSELQLDMGIRVPLANTSSNDLYGQNPYASHTVLLPVRNQQGGLEIKPALIARKEDVSPGFLPFTRENVTRQAFKFLGERYGWGHSYNARDCTGFVMEIYKTFGIYMPRNSGQQGSGTFGENIRFRPESTREERLLALAGLDVGDLSYAPGHVLMFLGNADGKPYVIHDVSEFGYTDENGEYYEGVLNGVSVTPFIPLHDTPEKTYTETMYSIKRIR